MNSGSTLVTTIVYVLFGGGLFGGLVALVKLRPEGAQILVATAKDVVVIQRGVIEDMEQRFASMEDRFEQQVAASTLSLAECHSERDDLRSELVAERLNSAELRARIEALEAEVAQLRTVNATRKDQP